MGIFDYWNYTLGEILDYIDCYNEIQQEKVREQALNNYQQALLTSIFINRVSNGKQPPSIAEIYPELFMDEAQEIVDNSWLIYKEQMLDFAEARNQQIGEVT